MSEKISSAKERRKVLYIIAIGGQITILLVAPVVLFLLLGFWLDSFFHTRPLFIILGVIFGFIGSIFNVFRVMEIMEKI